MTDTLTPGARRILEVASGLFHDHGIHAVGVDTIAAASGVTKRTLYDRFGSKDQLVAAYLRARDARWRADVTDALAAAGDAVGRLLAPFDVLEEWATARGCAFVNAFAELDDPAHPGRAVVADTKQWLLALFATELERAGLSDAGDLALQLLVLHEGALVAHAAGGQPASPRVARAAARALVTGR